MVLKKTKLEAHIDLTHYELPSFEQISQIEFEANKIVFSNAAVKKSIVTRKVAESTWGFVLYQGGAIPGNAIRVVDIEGVDTEACCGTHVDKLYEIGLISILQANKDQDGVFRLRFVAGDIALKSNQTNTQILRDVSLLLKVPNSAIYENASRIFSERNSFQNQTKTLSIDLLEAQVEVGVSKGYESFIIRRKEQNPAIFLKGLEKACSTRPASQGKNIFIIGANFFYALIQESLVDALSKEFEPILKESKSGPLEIEKDKKPKVFNFIGFTCKKTDSSSLKKISQILIDKYHFQE